MHKITLSIPIPQTPHLGKAKHRYNTKSDTGTVSLNHHTRLPEGN